MIKFWKRFNPWELFVRFHVWLDEMDKENLRQIYNMKLELVAYAVIEEERERELRKNLEEALQHRVNEIKAGRPYQVK